MGISKIEWTTHTWNPVTGCTPVSEGCVNCYARRRARRLAGRFGYRKRDPFAPRWRCDRFNEMTPKQKPRIIFVGSMGDLFHPALYIRPTTFDARRMPDPCWDNLLGVWDTMRVCWQHAFLVLTKRPHIMADLVPRLLRKLNRDIPSRNIWLGTSLENQRTSRKRRASMRKLAAAGWRTFVSYEPALGPIIWRDWEFIDWLIAGGETGPGARPAKAEWFLDARDWCKDQGIPFFFKQWGGVNKHLNGRLLAELGREFPPHLAGIVRLRSRTRDLQSKAKDAPAQQTT